MNLRKEGGITRAVKAVRCASDTAIALQLPDDGCSKFTQAVLRDERRRLIHGATARTRQIA
jgi:hypothetical protein